VGGSANTLDVSVGGVTHSFAGDGSTDFDTAFMHDVIQLVGSGALTTLSFTVHDGSLDSTDTVVDNVSIHAVPEPATWGLMLGGLGLAGAALRRRRAPGQVV
jgi:hypothetical protein